MVCTSFLLKDHCRFLKNSLLISVRSQINLLYRYIYLGLNPVINITARTVEMNLRDTTLQRFSSSEAGQY
jgi:hypothetical protein